MEKIESKKGMIDMNWTVKYLERDPEEGHCIDKETGQNFVSALDWVEKHKNEEGEQVRLSKRREVSRDTNYDKTYRISPCSIQAIEIARRCVGEFPSIEVFLSVLNKENRYVTDDLGEALEFINEIKEKLEII